MWGYFQKVFPKECLTNEPLDFGTDTAVIPGPFVDVVKARLANQTARQSLVEPPVTDNAPQTYLQLVEEPLVTDAPASPPGQPSTAPEPSITIPVEPRKVAFASNVGAGFEFDISEFVGNRGMFQPSQSHSAVNSSPSAPAVSNQAHSSSAQSSVVPAVVSVIKSIPAFDGAVQSTSAGVNRIATLKATTSQMSLNQLTKGVASSKTNKQKKQVGIKEMNKNLLEMSEKDHALKQMAQSMYNDNSGKHLENDQIRAANGAEYNRQFTLFLDNQRLQLENQRKAIENRALAEQRDHDLRLKELEFRCKDLAERTKSRECLFHLLSRNLVERPPPVGFFPVVDETLPLEDEEEDEEPFPPTV